MCFCLFYAGSHHRSPRSLPAWVACAAGNLSFPDPDILPIMILRRYISSILLIFLFVIPSIASGVDPLALAVDAAAAGEHERALRWYDEALAQNPEDQEALIGRLNALAALSRWDELLNLIATSGLESSAIERVAVLQAEGLVQTGKPDEALRILDASPGVDQTDVIRIRAEAMAAQGSISQALALLKQGEEEGISDPRMALQTGSLLIREGKVQESLPYLEKAYLGLPTNSEAPASLGDAATALGLYEEALIFFTEAVDLSPSDSSLWLTIAYLSSRLDRYDEALRALDHALAADPADASLLNARAYTLFLAGRGSEGRSLAEEVLRQHPGDPSAMDTLGSILLAEGSVDEALRYLEPAAELLPRDPEVLSHLAEAYHLNGRDAKAQDLYQRSLQLDSSSGRVWRGYSEVLLTLERYPEAAVAIARAFSFYPGDPNLIAWEAEADQVLIDWYLKEEAKNSTPSSSAASSIP